MPPLEAPAAPAVASVAAPPAPVATEAAPAVPAAVPERPGTLLEELAPGLRQGMHLPLAYRVATAVDLDPASAPHRRASASAAHNTSMLLCTPFYKPLSRCVGGR